jgi:hypothetical protein
MDGQRGYLEPVGELSDSAYTIEATFGTSPTSPLVLAGGVDHHLEGGYEFGVAELMSGVQTVDAGDGPHSGLLHQPHASNLLHPMHSPGLWILLLAAIGIGLFSGSGNLRLGPVSLSGGLGSR